MDFNFQCGLGAVILGMISFFIASKWSRVVFYCNASLHLLLYASNFIRHCCLYPLFTSFFCSPPGSRRHCFIVGVLSKWMHGLQYTFHTKTICHMPCFIFEIQFRHLFHPCNWQILLTGKNENGPVKWNGHNSAGFKLFCIYMLYNGTA